MDLPLEWIDQHADYYPVYPFQGQIHELHVVEQRKQYREHENPH